MGTCFFCEQINSPQVFYPEAIRNNQNYASIEGQTHLRLVIQKFSIFKYLSQMLEGVAYTQNQAADLAKALSDGVISLQHQQTSMEKQAVQQLFSQENVTLIKQSKLFYYGILNKLSGDKTQVSQRIKSRIYHTTANLKKEKEIDSRGPNKYKIWCIMSNGYKKLSQDELQEVVKYETISDRIREMGKNINFRFQSIQKESAKMIKLLSGCMIEHIAQISTFKYDLEIKEVMKMAQISKQACEQYDNGVFLLLAYFVQSCKNLQSKRVASQNIENLLRESLDRISADYPPGSGLSKENEQLIAALNSLSDQSTFNRVDFSHSQSILEQGEKQLQLQEIITEYAKTAEDSKDLFEELVRETCLEKGVYFKIGLKYYPKNPNPKALTRIKEKMLLKQAKCQFDLKGRISQILQREQDSYRKIVDEKLSSSKTVRFAISDMVRGKCVFLEIADIIQTVNSIKEFVKKDTRFGIKEIESRFNLEIPISDVTLKIVINKKIVAELQLTIQTNAATYNFAHKIYELHRTKVFSKIKIVHNYFEESKNDFSQLASKALCLMKARNSLKKEDQANIKQYFKLDSTSPKSFQRLFLEALSERHQQFQKITIAIDPLLQDLMLGIFCISIKLWYKPLGRIINSALKNQKISPKLKSVLISYFFETFQLPKESQYMQQLGFTTRQLQDKIFIEEFVREYFQVQKIFQYTDQNQRVFQRAQQLKEINFEINSFSKQIQLQGTRFVMNVVTQQSCPQIIQRLKEMFYLYLVTRKDNYGKITIYDQFSYYFNWINDQLDSTSDIDTQLLRSQIAILKSQQLLQADNLEAAQLVLEKALQVFKNREDQGKLIECEVLLTQCSIKMSKNSLEDCINSHLKLVKKAETLGLELKGALYADAMWRISEFLWEKTEENEKKRLLETFTKIAMRQLSRRKAKHFMYAMSKRWKQFNQRGVEQCQILENRKITYVKLFEIGTEGCKYLIKAKWDNLANLNLYNNNIGANGCQLLSRAKWSNLTQLYLWGNQIGDDGCEHLSRAKWDNLAHLNLFLNEIGPAGCEHLSKAKWDHFTQLNLGSNRIGPIGCEHLSKAKWEKLSRLSLMANIVGDEGCEHLSKGKWQNLAHLNLDLNIIRVIGCEHLSKAKWDNLTYLNLGNNYLKESDSKSIRALFIQKSIRICF